MVPKQSQIIVQSPMQIKHMAREREKCIDLPIWNKFGLHYNGHVVGFKLTPCGNHKILLENQPTNQGFCEFSYKILYDYIEANCGLAYNLCWRYFYKLKTQLTAKAKCIMQTKVFHKKRVIHFTFSSLLDNNNPMCCFCMPKCKSMVKPSH